VRVGRQNEGERQLANGGRSEIRIHHNSKLPVERRQHRDDAIGDAGPRHLGDENGKVQLSIAGKIVD
jgi:hypothetical protein